MCLYEIINSTQKGNDLDVTYTWYVTAADDAGSAGTVTSMNFVITTTSTIIASYTLYKHRDL